MTAKRRRRVWQTNAGALAALVLGNVTTATLAATGAFHHTAPAGWTTSGDARPGAACVTCAQVARIIGMRIEV
ncbi:hypothetical protein [Streptomyces sp. NPDC058086]|uniref:hypothetical protein n=1 Tax=Streptomyces sp. NPDC058086 TaxID=3346334 RepID=UPI0036ED1F26